METQTKPVEQATTKYVPQDFEAGWMQKWEADEF